MNRAARVLSPLSRDKSQPHVLLSPHPPLNPLHSREFTPGLSTAPTALRITRAALRLPPRAPTLRVQTLARRVQEKRFCRRFHDSRICWLRSPPRSAPHSCPRCQQSCSASRRCTPRLRLFNRGRINKSTTAPRPPTPRAFPTPQPPCPQNASAFRVSTGAPLSLFSQSHAHPLALDLHAVPYAPLGEAQQSQVSAPFSRHDMRVQLGAIPQHTHLSRVSLANHASSAPPLSASAAVALSAFANSAVSPQSGLLLTSFPPLSLNSSHAAKFNSQLQYSERAPRIASIVVVPAEPQLGTTSALQAVAPVIATACRDAAVRSLSVRDCVNEAHSSSRSACRL